MKIREIRGIRGEANIYISPRTALIARIRDNEDSWDSWNSW